MNILDEAARQNREIVTRDGRKPDWVHVVRSGLLYGFNGADGWQTTTDEGRFLISQESNLDLILAPKKATIWYRVRDGEVVQTHMYPPIPTNAPCWYSVEVDLP